MNARNGTEMSDGRVMPNHVGGEYGGMESKKNSIPAPRNDSPTSSMGSALAPAPRSHSAATSPIGITWAVGGHVTGRSSFGSLAASMASLENSSAVRMWKSSKAAVTPTAIARRRVSGSSVRQPMSHSSKVSTPLTTTMPESKNVCRYGDSFVGVARMAAVQKARSANA